MATDSASPTGFDEPATSEQRGHRWLPWGVLSLIVASGLVVQNFYHNLWYDAFAPPNVASRLSRRLVVTLVVSLHNHRVRTISHTEETIVVASAASSVVFPVSAGVVRDCAFLVDSWICTVSSPRWVGLLSRIRCF